MKEIIRTIDENTYFFCYATQYDTVVSENLFIFQNVVLQNQITQ